LIRDKASFNQSRLFLLTLPILALLFSQWTITIYSPPTKYVEIAAPASTSTPASNVETNSFNYNQSHNTAAVSPSETKANINGLSQLLNAKSVLLICVLIAFLFMVPAIWQCIQLLLIRRNGKVSAYKGFEVVTSSAIPTPFSLYKTIFVNENLKPKKQEIILKHESWHIKHRHYIDVFIIEFITRLFWFNPLLWWVRKELRSVCEFQADKSVLEDGQEIYTYQTLILEEVMGQSSFLANGFNNSFTKKRFMSMKSNPNLRLNNLRGILLPIFLLLIFGSLSFSIGKQKTEYIVKEARLNKTEKSVELISIGIDSTINGSKIKNVNDSLKTNRKYDTVIAEITDSLSVGNKKMAITKEMEEVMDKSIKTLSEGLGISSLLLEKLAESDDKKYYRSSLPAVFNSINSLFYPKKYFDESDFSDEYINTITKTTLINSSINFLSVKAELNKLKFEKSAKVKFEKYPKLCGQVRTDNLIWPLNRQKKYTIVESNNSKTNITTEPTKEELDKERNSKLWREAYKATDLQAKACDVPFSEKARIDRIENDLTSNETKISLFVPIYSDNFWLRFDKGFEITDLETHDKYLIRRLEDGLPLNKSIIIKNKKHKMVSITLVFPLIRTKAKRIDVFENIADYSEIMSNDAGQVIFRNINVPDYLVTKSKSGKIYK
jgi:beta-lactamase regulating signal transducer with metallopeptidase domain